MRLIEAKCQNCHADLDVDLDNLQAKCPYCGAKLILEFDVDRYLENKEETLREQERLKEETIQKEKAYKFYERAKKAEAKRRKEELKYEDRKDRREKTTSSDRTFIAMMILMVLMLLIVTVSEHFGDFVRDRTNQGQEKIQITVSSEEIKEGKYNYKEVQEIFKSAGFTNIKIEKDEDVKLGLLRKPDLVKKVTINGEKTFEQGSWWDKDARVVITYHAKKDKKK